MNAAEATVVSTPADLSEIATGRRVVFLSASVPTADKITPTTGPALTANLRRWAASASYERIREAVRWLCRSALDGDYDLVFGGHPAITPLVLAAARDREPATSGRSPTRVFVFQSKLFEQFIPASTYELADWSAGRLLWTPAVERGDKDETRAASLTLMRTLMAQWPRLAAGVFIGGMDGILEESELFAQYVRRPDGGPAPRYALASTGGAAIDLLDADPLGHRGGLDSDSMLRESEAYSAVFWRIFEELEPAR